MSQRVVLFLDYQNIYRRAREAFFTHEVDPHFRGQISPIALGELLVKRSPFIRELSAVRIYRGLPSNDRDPIGYSAARRQINSWQMNPRVQVITHSLRYPKGWPHSHQQGEKPVEKGIDVSLAIDFVAMAVRDEYDIGILFSMDSDLKPALAFVSNSDLHARAEVAAWSRRLDGKMLASYNHPRLSLTGNKPFCHWLDNSDYKQICDETNYRNP